MASNFQIPLAVNAPQPTSPLTSIGALMNLRGQMSEIALRQAQTETAKQQQQLVQAEQQQKNRDIEDVNNYTALMKDPAVQSAFGANGDVTPFQKAGIQPKFIESIVKARQEQLQGKAVLDKDTLANQASAISKIKETAVNLMTPNEDGTPPDPATVDSRYQSAKAYLGPLMKIAGLDSKPLPASLTDPDQIKQIIADLHGAEGIYTASQGYKAKQAETAQKGALTAKDQADADFNKYKLDLLKGNTNPATDAALMDKLFTGHPDLRAQADAIYATGKAAKPLEPGAGVDAVKAFYDEQVGKPAGAAATVTAETQPKIDQARRMIPVEAAAAGARASAETGPMIDRATRTQQALAKLSPDAFAAIPDTVSRREAMNESDKIDKEYTDKVGASLQLLDTINAAQKGNKAAPGVIPIEQVRSVLSNGRVNQAELRGVSTQAGSLMDKIEGWVKGKAEGEPIPPDILRDTAALAVIQQQAAKRTYDAGLQRLAKRGVDTSKISTPSMGGASQTIRARDPQGKLHEAPAGTALPAGWKLEP